jgi:hypothetical protein
MGASITLLLPYDPSAPCYLSVALRLVVSRRADAVYDRYRRHYPPHPIFQSASANYGTSKYIPLETEFGTPYW